MRSALQSFVPEDMPVGQCLSLAVFRTLKELLDTYLAMPQIDKDRIYVMGLSMGGMGTFDMAVRYPESFCGSNTYLWNSESGTVEGWQIGQVSYFSWRCG